MTVLSSVVGNAMGVYDDFWQAGGDSLQAVDAASQLARNLSIRLPATVLLKYPTAAQLAERVRRLQQRRSFFGLLRSATATPCLVTALNQHSSPELAVLPGGSGGEAEMVAFVRLLQAIPALEGVIGFRATHFQHSDRLASVEQIAGIYQDALRHRGLADQPLLFIGECIAGVIAFELVRRRCVESDRLVLLDARLPRADGNDIRKYPRRCRNYVRAAGNYLPGICHNDVDIIQSSEFAARNSAKQWLLYLRGQVKNHVVAATHDSYIRKDAQPIAAILQECLMQWRNKIGKAIHMPWRSAA